MIIRNFRRLRLWMLCGALALATGTARADDEIKTDSIGDSLGDALLEDLEGDLLDGLEIPPKKAAPTKEDAGSPDGQPKQDEDGGSKLDRELEKHLGEDVQLENDEPFGRIADRMRSVEERFARRDPAKKTQQLQEEIVAELDELIKKVRRQKKKPSGSSSSSKGSQRSKVQQPKSSPGNNSGRTSQQPAPDSSQRVGREETKKIDMAEMKSLLKDLWGELPPRERERLIQNSVEEFLPKYEIMIEQYFRRLAEEPGALPK